MESARYLLEDYLIINLSKLSIHFIFDGRRQKKNKMILKNLQLIFAKNTQIIETKLT